MSRSRTRFVPDHGFERPIRAQATYQRAMVGRALRVFPHVQLMTPENTGYAHRSLFVLRNTIVSRDPFWHLIEFGSVNNRAYAPMRSGVLSAGLTYRDARVPLI